LGVEKPLSIFVYWNVRITITNPEPGVAYIRSASSSDMMEPS